MPIGAECVSDANCLGRVFFDEFLKSVHKAAAAGAARETLGACR